MKSNKLVALIRGINVGTAKRVPMADLRALVESLGYSNVHTLLNSGNVVFDAYGTRPRDTAACIEAGLASRVGVSARVTVLTAKELADAVSDNPLARIADNPSRLLVCFLADATDRSRLAPLTKRDWTPESLAIGKRVAYLWCPPGIIASRLQEAIGRILGDAVTTRNWATVIKLHALRHRGD